MEHSIRKVLLGEEEARPPAENEKSRGVREVGRKGNSLGQMSWKTALGRCPGKSEPSSQN